jgi:SNF2 family DNA or RNA helicase
MNEAFKCNGIVITSYEFLRSDVLSFQSKGGWMYIILDEAQKIKNCDSLVHKAVMALSAHHRLILSGTPMQNNL